MTIFHTFGRCSFALLAGASLLGGLAHGQQQPPATAPQAQVQEIVVTGSRIVVPNATSTSPVQVVTAQEIALGGKTDMIDVINQLPQNFQNSAVDFSNTSNALVAPGGLSTADLRGLGPQRTLVLINGRRLGTADPNTGNPNPAPDLDQIPVALVERVDVVTGGASATYGSDAIAGVVNFIMKRNFEGFQVDGQLGEYWHENHEPFFQNLEAQKGFQVTSGTRHDGQNKTINILAGTNFADGAGNVTAYLSYLKAEPITSGARDFASCQLDADPTLSQWQCRGSPNSNLFTSPLNQQVYTVVGNQLLPWPHPGSNPPPEFNSQSYIYMARGDERYSAGFFAHDDLSRYAKPYAEFGFMNDRTTTAIAPSGLFQGNPTDPTGNGNFNVNCSNPLLSAQEAALLCTPAQIAADRANPGSASANVNIGRRNVEGGGRVSFYEHSNYRAVLGTRGELADGWGYDAYGQYYYTTLYNSNSRYLNFANVDQALQVTGTAANPVCISGPPCVPWNIFNEGGVTQDQLAFLYTNGTAYGAVTQKILHADLTGDLGLYHLQSPWANDGLRVNFGAEHRNEHLTFTPDAAELSGLLSGFGGASVAIDNGYAVKEQFVELRAPLAQDRPGLNDLVFDTGYRRSDYSTAGVTNTYKFEVQYAPLPDLRLRGSFQRAVRAPNIIELFAPQAFGLISPPGIDPCAKTVDPVTGVVTPATATLAECERTGVTPAQYGNGGTTDTIKQCAANQCGQLMGGNEKLIPEIADSYTFGVNFAPQALPGLTGSLDYYRIVLNRQIGTVAATVILSKCLQTGDPTYCKLIVRDAGGSITGSSVQTGGYIVQTGVNIGAGSVKGIDVQTNYKWTMEHLGSVLFSLNGAALLADTSTPQPGAHTYDCAGLYGPTCSTLNPRWRHNLRATWNTPWPVGVSLFWRYIGSVRLDENDPDPSLNAGKYRALNARLPAVSYLDLATTWDFAKGLQLRAGINNLFDKDPPVVGQDVAASGLPNAYPTYDTLGRQLFLAFTATF
ncbi:MAG: TonB-dependent receptor [Gammaproteobacteria bacterium]|nr:TonB-dependent receptor [Gammaproteobacteria bacterium]